MLRPSRREGLGDLPGSRSDSLPSAPGRADRPGDDEIRNRPPVHSLHGYTEPRKNILGVLRAYADLCGYPRCLCAGHRGCGKGWLDEEITEALSRLRATGANVIQTGCMDDDDLPALFSGASVFAFPSFYEGFGMPPLEAMACGTPVITSRASSLPEVVGDAAELVDPHDVSSIAAALERVLRDPSARRSLLRGRASAITHSTGVCRGRQLRQIIHQL